MKTIPIVLCVDVEPLARELDIIPSNNWEGFEETARVLGAMRPRFEAATGSPVHYSWFLRMDPQVAHTFGTASWVTERYADTIAKLEQAGDEIGLHTHAWRWNSAAGNWVVDHGDQRWVDYCVESSFEAYRRAFGRSCRSFRFGDHWMNDHTMRLLGSLGVQFDLTIEPGIKARTGLVSGEAHTGSLPDYSTTPRWPYQPSIRDFRKPTFAERHKLWIVPLSTARHGLGRFPALKRAALALGLDWHRRYEPTPLYLGHEEKTFCPVRHTAPSRQAVGLRSELLSPMTGNECPHNLQPGNVIERAALFAVSSATQ
jgi:peptidoglycan/xylan/chitin deacetylase (PgdA/CDA1 family)